MNINQPIAPLHTDYSVKTKIVSISSSIKSFATKQQISPYNALDISNNYNNNDPNIYMLLP